MDQVYIQVKHCFAKITAQSVVFPLKILIVMPIIWYGLQCSAPSFHYDEDTSHSADCCNMNNSDIRRTKY